ncbi:MAG: hypothetical protein M3R13_04140 [Armatimonadota bacterium]|nr:hypothetical protein [Armatimonadota bacterium]
MSVASQPLDNRTIFRFYYPLALSWLFMAIESPISIGVLSRLPLPDLSTAAFFIMMGLSLWIESPVIDLLSTSTTLAKNRRDFRVLTTFVYWVIGLVTALHALVAFTPLFGWITGRLMGVPENVSEAALPGFRILLLWSACIGWRRFLQGVLIRYGETKKVGFGTFVRMAAMSAAAAGLYLISDLRGIEIAAISLMAAVAAESLYIHMVAGPVIREKLELIEDTGDPQLTMRKLVAFHAPLTATTAVMMIGSPVVAWALAKAPNSVLTLAGWQVASTLMWMCRTVVYALPEVVITLYNDAQSAEKLRRYCLGVGLATTGSLLFFAAFGIDVFFFKEVLNASEPVANIAHMAFIASAALPLIGAMQSYIRGMLTAHHLTVQRFAAVIVAMGALVVALFVTIVLGYVGVISAAIAMSFALLAELWLLMAAFRRASGGEKMVAAEE